MTDDTLVLSLDAEALGAQLAAELGCAHAAIALHRFPDGEALVRLPADVAGRRVLLAARLDQPDARTLPAVFAADAARELGAWRVGLVAPYLPYMRQDMRFHPGEAISSRSYARLLSGAFDFLVTVDPHLHRWPSLDAIYTIPSRVVAAAPALAAWIARAVDQPLLVGPDAESAQWVAEVARHVGAPWTCLRKERHGDREVEVAFTEAVDFGGRTPVLVDDILSTGRTLVAAAQALRAVATTPSLAVVVHALADDDAPQSLQAAGLRAVSCDTVPHASNAIALAPLLAPAVRALLGSD